MTTPAPGNLGEVTVRVISVDIGAGTASVRVLDNNGSPITPPATLPLGVIRVIVVPAVIGDVLESVDNGITAVVRFVDAGDTTRWSPSASGTPLRSTEGWVKVGTFTPTP